MKPSKGRGLIGKVRVSGVFFCIILVLVLLAAWNTGANMFYILVGALSSFVILSWVLARLSLRKLTMLREAPSAVHRGEPFTVHLRIENEKYLMPAVSLLVQCADRGRETLGYILRVPARRAAVLSVPFVFERRGVYTLPPFDLSCSYPFGLFEKRVRFADKKEMIVYPRVQTVRTTVVEQAAGGRYMAQKPTNDGDEFYGLREYVVGDDPRMIAWRVSARLGKWVVRELARENSRYVIFAIDTRRVADMSDFEDRFEEAVDLIASLSASLLKRQYNVGIVAPQTRLDGGEGNGHLRAVLETLARLEYAQTSDYPDFDKRVDELEAEMAVVLYFSADPARWGRKTSLDSVRVVDPREVMNA